MVFLSKVLKHLPDIEMEENGDGDSDCESEGECGDNGKTNVRISLLWMVKRMRRVINIEIAETPKETAMVIIQLSSFIQILLVLVDKGLPKTVALC